jgi:hypothetical protein
MWWVFKIESKILGRNFLPILGMLGMFPFEMEMAEKDK